MYGRVLLVLTNGTKKQCIYGQSAADHSSSVDLLMPALHTVPPLPLSPPLRLFLRPDLGISVNLPPYPFAISALRVRSWASRAARLFSASACSRACWVKLDCDKSIPGLRTPDGVDFRSEV